MYQVYADGQILWSSDMSTEETAIADPRISLEVNTAGTFEFTIHPTHYLYDSLFKMKTIIQVLWDDTEIFYGRVLDTERSMYLEKNVTCEGALAFLNDSVQQPLDPKTKYSVTQVMQMLIEAHNNQTEAEKHFTLGTVTLGGSDTYNFDRQTFEDSRSALEDLLELFDGYVRIRHEDGTMYLDLLDDYDRTVNQNIEFGVNLADLTVNDQADDLFTALYPLGVKNVTVASVNDGNPIIEDEDLIAIYGKIVRAQTFDGVSDPAVLLQNGREYLQTYGVQIPMEYDIKAIDLHFFDYEKDLLLPGFTVPILSAPHDIDEDSLICIRCELELQNPENNSYTIGIPDPFNGGGSGGMSYGNTSLTNTVNRTTKRMTNDENKLSLAYDEIDIKAQKLEADIGEIHARTDELEITVGTGVHSGEAGSITGSALWMNRNSITAATGKLEVDTSGNLHVKDGSGLYLGTGSASLAVYTDSNLTAGIIVNKINGGTAKIQASNVVISGTKTVATLSGTVEEIGNRVGTIEGSAIWQNRDSITSVVGKMSVDSSGKIHVISGSGLMIDSGSASFGVYAENNLTAGVIVNKINNDTSVSISGARVNITANTQYSSLVGTVNGQGDKISEIEGSAIWQNRNSIVAAAGKLSVDANGKLHVVNGSGLFIDSGSSALQVYDSGSLTAGVIVDKINGGTTTISGAKVNIEANDAFNLKVGKGEVISSINATSETVTIAARKVNLSGYTEISAFSSLQGDVNDLKTGQVTATHLRTSAFSITGSSFSLGGYTYTSATRQYVSSLTTKTVSIQDSVTGQVTTFKAVDSFTTSGATFLVRLNT